MFSNLLENPKLFRHLVEDLPVGIYIVDQDRRIRFWNRGVERITGYLSHEVVGHVLEDAVQICDRRGNQLIGEYCPVTMTLNLRKSQQCTAFSLHKSGHRTAVRIRTRPILEYGDNIGGATVLVEEAFAYREATEPPMYGCLDATTGIPSSRLTRAVLTECMAGLEATRHGFGVVRIRILGLEEFRAKHGPQSVVPFLRTAAHTLRHSLGEENFLGCWEEHEFLAVLSSASPAMVAMTAEVLSNLLSHSEVFWWGDHFTIEAEVTYTVAAAGDNLETILGEIKAPRTGCAAKAAAAGDNNGDSGRSRG
ncbi:MAG: PAS domain-containing protein [Terriglobales bacterium]